MKKVYSLLAGLVLATGMMVNPAVQAKGQAGVFDYYLLTLSWSPTFCLTHTTDQQCTKGYGFVLHGLWPQYTNGGWPQDCPPITTLTAQERKYGNTLFPTDTLLTHEWSKHGTCSGLGANGYLQAADNALTKVKIPASFQAPTKPLQLTAQQILDAFHQSNPGLAQGSIVAVCSGPELSEIRVCMDKDLNAQSCGKAVKTQCRDGNIRVPNVR
ncbi:ribonuclease T2 [Dickeya dianthicola]|uniref:ribonuclease T2 family protein n=1 Tax=Dickeya dianthicola TaxID=204039 RepID=UPI00136CB6EA|nr:ribonuclease T2 [Dickeya dianthicola]MBT1427958.1 ribonuclease T2 [Dickeya dianthicola]MBT1459472.1 ribonuclease T2 [Dickeya dianthicola]MBT1488670.1 ribonuclease T2 [Dickeya dianthicola]MCI4185334.1 ribonuclease T2 [Dickeya dianthicola]MCI4202800.1 ribonuclease T2 [Dickeya dianthicola]